MVTLAQRIKRVIVYHGTTMTNFAKELNISQSMVSKICSGKAIPSERTISDICRVFNINREWLTEGTGEMTDKQSLEEELSELMGYSNDSSVNNQLKHSIISILVSTPPAAWSVIADYLYNAVNDCKENKKANGTYTYEDAYRKGIQMAQEIDKLVKSLPIEPKE